MTEVLVRNAGYEPMRVVTPRKAHGMILRGKARPLGEFHPNITWGGQPVPKEIILTRYVHMKWMQGVPSYSKKRLFIRDNYTCVYCGGKATTQDHDKPKSRGGENTWENLISACFKCNSKKGNRTPEEAGMVPSHRGFQPTWAQVVA